MKNLKNYFISGVIGVGSLGFLGNNGYGQEKDNALENAIKKYEIVDSMISINNSMIPSYNQCIRNGTKSNKDGCEKIFLEKLIKYDSLLNEFKSFSFEEDSAYSIVEGGILFDYGQVPFTNESADSLIKINKKFYDATAFLINNPLQKNYDAWRNQLETYKNSCRSVFKQ